MDASNHHFVSIGPHVENTIREIKIEYEKRNAANIFHFNVALLLPASLFNLVLQTTWFFSENVSLLTGCTMDGRAQTQKENLSQAAIIFLSSLHATIAWGLTLKKLRSERLLDNQSNQKGQFCRRGNFFLSAANILGCLTYLGFAVDRMVNEYKNNFDYCRAVNTPTSLIFTISFWILNAAIGLWGWKNYNSSINNFFARPTLSLTNTLELEESKNHLSRIP